MSRRIEHEQTSTQRMIIRVTPEEEARIRGTAQYLGKPYSQLLREYEPLLRQALYDVGLRPPLQASEESPAKPRSIEIIVMVKRLDRTQDRVLQLSDSAGPKTPRR